MPTPQKYRQSRQGHDLTQAITSAHDALPVSELMNIDTIASDIAEQVHNLGEQGAVELLGKLGIYIIKMQESHVRKDLDKITRMVAGIELGER